MSMSKKIILAATGSLLALTATSALASGPVAVQPVPEVVYTAPVATAHNWAGGYGGLSFSRVSGGINENTTPGGVTPDMEGDNAFGVFAGYNWQSGNLVYGGELNYTHFATPFVGFPGSQQENVIELRARLGYAVNNVLIYGFVGAARSSIEDGGISASQNGVSYGLGAQMAFRNNMFAGLEVGRRDVSGDVPTGTVGTDIDTATLRVGFQF